MRRCISIRCNAPWKRIRVRRISRLAYAADSGVASLPEDVRIAIFRPHVGYDLGVLKKLRCQVISPDKSVHVHFTDLGFECVLKPDGCYGAAVVFVSRFRQLTQSMIAMACSVTEGPVIVDGDRKSGVESILRACKARTDVCTPIAKAHGKLFMFDADDVFSDWAVSEMREIEDGFFTSPGVFSADSIDPASRLLADALPRECGPDVVDLGGGWGYLSVRVLERDSIEKLYFVEVDNNALECARRNVRDVRALFQWSDALAWRPPEHVDIVMTNPPFHSGWGNAPQLGRAFIRAAAGMLKPGGELYLVANRHLAYEREMTGSFTNVKEVGGDHRFKILHGHKPRGGRSRTQAYVASSAKETER